MRWICYSMFVLASFCWWGASIGVPTFGFAGFVVQVLFVYTWYRAWWIVDHRIIEPRRKRKEHDDLFVTE